MRILVVTQYFWPENFRINDLVAELQKRGHSPVVLTGKPNYPSGSFFPEYLADPAAFSSFEGVEVLRLPILRRAQGSFRLILNYLSFVVTGCLWAAWLLRDRKFDLVFVYEPSPITVALPAILLGKLKNAPVVLWVLDLWPDTLQALGVIRSPAILKPLDTLVRFIYRHCTLILGQSRAFAVRIAEQCGQPEKVRYFPSWTEEIFEGTQAEKAPEVPPGEDFFNILFAGNVGDSQDFPSILEAAERLRLDLRVRWLIVGDGRKSSWLRQEVARRGLEKNILLLGRHPVERMPSFYAHADALLVSLKKTPVFGMTIPGKLQSYLMIGIPILGMIDGEGAEIIQTAHAGICCGSKNPEGLARIVRTLVEMPKGQRDKMGQAGRQYAKQEFDRNKLITRLEKMFSESIQIFNQTH